MKATSSSTPKRVQAKQQLSQLMGLSQKDLSKLLFDEKSADKLGQSSTPKSNINRSTMNASSNSNYYTSNNKSQKINTILNDKEEYKPSFSSSKSPIRRPPQLSQSPLLPKTILTEMQNQQATPTQQKDFYFSIRKNSKTPPKKVQLTPLMINEEGSIEVDKQNKNQINGDKNIQQYINQFESVLSPVSTASISYSTLNPHQDAANNYQTNNSTAITSAIQNTLSNPFQNSFNTVQSYSPSPYANSNNNLTKQLVNISNQTEKYFKSPNSLAQSTPSNKQKNVSISQQQQQQQIWKSPQNSQRHPEIVTEKQIVLQDLKNKILSMKVNAKDTVFLTNQIKEKFEQCGGYSYEFLEEKNIFVLKYYIHLAHDEIDRLVQKKKNLLLSRNQAFNQFLTQFINGINKSKISLKDEYYNLLPSAVDLKEIVSKDIALLYKNLEKENNQQVYSTLQQSPQKQNEETNPNYHSQIQTKYTNPLDVQQIPPEIKQLLVKANIQISNLQKELDIEKQKVKIYCETNQLEEDFESELKNLKIQNCDLRKQIQELNSENGNLFRKFSESEKLCKQLKEENYSLNSKIMEKGQKLESLYKDLEECKISLQQMITAQQNEKSSIAIQSQENEAKYNILNEKNQLLEERIKSKEDLIRQKESENNVLTQRVDELKNLQEINQLLLDVDKKDHNLVTNLICLVNKFENNELPRNTQMTVIKYLDKLNILSKYSSISHSPNQQNLFANLQSDFNQNKRTEKIKSINNQTLHLLNLYMQKLMDKIVKQQVLHEELIWFKDNIQRLVEKFLQMSKNQISFNHIDFFKQEIEIKYDRIQQKISQISPDISQLESEMQEIAADQVKFIKTDFEESTDDDMQEIIDRNQLNKENSKLKMEIQHLNSQIQQLNIKDQLIANSLTSIHKNQQK